MLTGVILAGGMSRRYGRNKALEVFRGERLIDRGVKSLRAQCDHVLVIANDVTPYIGIEATLLKDFIPHAGPLGGIYTALLFSPSEWIFVKATDMPFLVPEVLSLLLELRDGADVVVPLSQGRYEPLHGLYNRRALAAIAEDLERKERRVSGFYRNVRVKMLAEERWRSVDPEGLSIMNVNSPEDWERLDGVERGEKADP